MSAVAGVAERPASGELADAIELAQLLRAARVRLTPLTPPLAVYVVHAVAQRLAHDPAARTANGELGATHVLIARDGTIEVTNGCFNIAALGALLYECLTLRKVSLDGDSAPPSVVTENIPASVDALVAGLLGGNYAGCDEAAAALAPLTRELGGDRAGLARLLSDLESALPRRIVVAPHGDDDQEGSLGHAQTVIAKRATSPGAAGKDVDEDAETVQPPAPARDHGWKIRWAITAVAALLAFAVPALLRRAQETKALRDAAAVASSALPPAAPAALPPAPPATTAGTVHLRARGPAGALATLDDQPVGALPLDLLLPSTSNVRQLAVTANHFRPWSRALSGNMDVDITVDLVPNQAPPAKHAAAAPTPAPAPAASAKHAAAAAPAKHVIRNPFAK